MTWYYAQGEEKMGPVDDAGMDQLVRSGSVTAQTLVWKEGMEQWQPLSTVANVAEPDAAATPAVPESLYGNQTMQGCAECGRTFPSDEMVAYQNHWVCASCKGAFFQRVREGGRIAGEMRYVGFWKRFSARFVDGFIMNIATYAIAIPVGIVLGLLEDSSTSGSAESIAVLITSIVSMLLPIVYEVFFLGKYGATPGKMAMGIKVVMSDGSPITYGRATARIFAMILSYITLMIGFIMAAFDEEKRSLHDRICDTRVVFK